MENITHQELITLLHYNEETGNFTWAVTRQKGKIGEVAGYFDGKYICIKVKGFKYKAHRLAWFYKTQKWPEKFIDHVNGNKTDNRFFNLREASSGENRANSVKNKNNKTGFKGVVYKKWIKEKPYQAQITHNKKVIYIGCYATPEEAHQAYENKAKILHGDFAKP